MAKRHLNFLGGIKAKKDNAFSFFLLNYNESAISPMLFHTKSQILFIIFRWKHWNNLFKSSACWCDSLSVHSSL